METRTHSGLRIDDRGQGLTLISPEGVQETGCGTKAFYLTLGAYDIVTLIEVPNDEGVTKFVLALASAGNVRTTTLKAFPEAEYRKIIQGLP